MECNDFLTQFHIQLTDQQLEAMKSVEDPTLLLAVPGSGKTTTLIARLGYLIYCCNVQPEKILTITYTVAATAEMRERFSARFGEEIGRRMDFRTINSLCQDVLRYYESLSGRTMYTLLSDEGQRKGMLSEIYRKVMNDYATESDLQSISAAITYVKNMHLTGDEIKAYGAEMDYLLEEIYSTYCSTMKDRSLMDFDDQLTGALAIFKSYPQILKHYQEKYRFICVDEAQDTSRVQHEVLALLASKYEKIFMVGDEDQSIYGFRAAYPEALLHFEEQHKNARVLVLTQNFRSNAKIVKAADGLIRHNSLRHEKSMQAVRMDGSDIHVIDIKARSAQYSYLLKVASDVREQTAILYRDNESILPVVDLLDRNKIQYRMRGRDFSFFSHRTVLDVCNIIRFAYDPENTELFLQIYYKINTHLKKAEALELCGEAQRRDLSIPDTLNCFHPLPIAKEKTLKTLFRHLELVRTQSAVDAFRTIRSYLGYDDYLDRSGISDRKMPILQALVRQLSNISELTERLTELEQLCKDSYQNPTCQLILSTIHSAKGQEYHTVYLLDAIDGVFPENVPAGGKPDIEMQKVFEEERRLYYVAVTRAKDNLHIFRFEPRATFTDELVKRDTDLKSSATDGRMPPVSTLKEVTRNKAVPSKKKSAHLRSLTKPVKAQKKVITQAEYEDKYEELESTGYVKHAVFGEGRILEMDGVYITVEFPTKTAKLSLQVMMENDLIE